MTVERQLDYLFALLDRIYSVEHHNYIVERIEELLGVKTGESTVAILD